MEHYAGDRPAAARVVRRGGRADRRRRAASTLEPALKPGLAGGWHYECDAHLRPDRLMAAWRRVLEARGVTVREDCDGQAASSAKAAGRGPSTRRRASCAADAFVVATGAWTPLLEQRAGLPRADPAGQGLLDHDAAAGALPARIR